MNPNREANLSNTSVSNSRHRFVSKCGNYVYHLAIIDYLQAFTFEKWGESRFKTWVLRRSEDLISAVDPDKYGLRFTKFMKSEVLLDTILDLKFDEGASVKTKI